ncbi:MAG: hypothetical protein JXA74_17535 [Anaerolineae bacterium]|nr:hypothetical protein [Anaerolineae bacterium]
MLGIVALFGVALVGLGVAGWYSAVVLKRARALLEAWAEEQGYQILEANPRPLSRGLHSWSSKGQVVYRVRIRQADGRERTGWVCCGAPLRGVFADKVEAHWDRESDPPC